MTSNSGSNSGWDAGAGARSGLAPRKLGAVPSNADETRLRMRDGVRLATDVYLPTSVTNPVATVVCRLPYDKNDPENTLEQIARRFNDHGYAFVAQDTRGKGRSEGDAWPFTSETDDAYDTFDWIAEQSWSDGRIATWGASYYGFTQWAAVASKHPALIAAMPTMTTSRAQDWLWCQGVFELGFATAWSGITWVDEYVYPFGLQFDWTWPLSEVLPNAFGGRDSLAYRFMRSAGPNHPFWTTSLFPNGSPAHAPTIPMLHSGGWWDVFNRGQVADWGLASATSTAPQFLVMDAVDHAFGEWTPEPGAIFSVYDYSSVEIEEFCDHLLERPLAFLDHVASGAASTEPKVRWRLTHGDWEGSAEWPPPNARPQRLFLDTRASGATLDFDRPATASWIKWRHDPVRPVPTLGEPSTMYNLCVPPDDSLLEQRDDVLVFTSNPFESHATIAGPIVADLYVSSSENRMDVVVKLIDVAPDGATRRIRDGAAQVETSPGGTHVRVDLGHTGYLIRAGHRLRIHLASSDFPRFLPYLGAGRDPWTDPPGPASTQRVCIGGSTGSSVAFAVIE